MTVLYTVLGVVGLLAMFGIGILIGQRRASIGPRQQVSVEQAANQFLAYKYNEALGQLSESDMALYENGDESVVKQQMNAILDGSVARHRELRLRLESAIGQAGMNEMQSRMYEKVNPSAALGFESVRSQFAANADRIRAELTALYADEWRRLQPQLPTNTPAQ